MQPGKHQIIIKDQLTGHYFVREIVVDVRKRDIIDCSKFSVYVAKLIFAFSCTDHVEPERTSESIKRYETVDEITGQKREMIDLENSVFMNFRRYTKKDVLNCFEADMRNSSFDLVKISE